MPPDSADDVTLQMNIVQNPFPLYRLERAGPSLPAERKLLGWQWRDENGCTTNFVYPTQLAALQALVAYMGVMERGLPWWQRAWLRIKEFWSDTRG